MKTLYICHTVYHLFVTLSKVSSTENDTVMVFETISNREKLLENLKKSTFNTAFLLLEKTSSFDVFHFDNYHEIFIFNDYTTIGQYFRDNKISYHLIEDGYNYYQYKMNFKFLIKLRFLLKFMSLEKPLGFSKCVQTIEVNSLKNLPKDSRRRKWREVPRKKLWQNLPEERKIEIAKIFDFKDFNQNYNGILVLTQPLFQDKWDINITTEEAQLNYYKHIIQQYADDSKIYMKVHPRDTTDYSSLENVTFLDKHIPMEIYEMMCHCHFSKGITHSSTVLDFLSCVEDKIILSPMK